MPVLIPVIQAPIITNVLDSMKISRSFLEVLKNPNKEGQ